MTSINRETWLNNLAALMAPRFAELGHPLPAFRVSVGWTSGGSNARANGECWNSSTTTDSHFSVFISPAEGDTMMFAAILFHELVHCAVGLAAGHKGSFAKVMAAGGMDRPFTSSIPGDGFREWVAPFLAELGDIPHCPIKVRQSGAAGLRLKLKRGPAGIDAADEPAEGGDESSGPKRQTTRMHKVCCTECGYTARVSSKWLDVGRPSCPNHGPMEVAGVDA